MEIRIYKVNQKYTCLFFLRILKRNRNKIETIFSMDQFRGNPLLSYLLNGINYGYYNFLDFCAFRVLLIKKVRKNYYAYIIDSFK